MSERRAREILTSIAVRFRARHNMAVGPLPNNASMGRSARGPSAIDALLRWAIEIAVREGANRAMQLVEGPMEGFRTWALWGYHYDPNPEQVEMTIWLLYANRIEDEIVVTARRAAPAVSVDVRLVAPGSRREVPLAHVDGLESMSFTDVVITATTTAPGPSTNASRPPANAPQSASRPGSVLPHYVERAYPSANGPRMPVRRGPALPRGVDHTYPSANAPRTGHPLGH